MVNFRNHTILGLENSELWRKATKGIPCTFAHTWEYNYAISKNFNIPIYLYVYQYNNIKIICPIVEREYNGYLDIAKPFGISGFTGNKNYPLFYKEWLEFVDKKGYVCGYFTLNPYMERNYFKKEDVILSNDLYVLDLKKGERELLSGMSSGRRDQIKKIFDYENKIINNKNDIVKFFKTRYNDNLKSLGASTDYYLNDEALDIIAFSSHIEMLAILEKNNIVSAIIYSTNAKLGELHYKITLAEYKNHSVYLDWAAIKKIMKSGCTTVGFGGDIGSKGLANYKLRFGTRTIPVKQIKHVYYEKIYHDLCDHYKKKSNTEINIDYFPEYHGKMTNF